MKNRVEDFLYEKETYLIRGASYRVWKELGGAFKESVIDRAMNIELRKHGFKVESQKRLDIFYDKIKIGTFIPDIIVNERIIVELKCKPFIKQADEAQFWRYLRGSQYKLGLLINFSPQKVEIKRCIYDKARLK